MKKLKIAIIGATGSGQKRTIPSLQQSKIVEVTAVQGRNLEKLNTIQERFGINAAYTDTREMLANEDVDIVYIATPPFLHKRNIEEALSVQKPILCEKPLAHTLSEAKAIAATLSKANVQFMLAHHLRHQPAIRDIKKLLDTGQLGSVTSVWCQWAFVLNLLAPSAKWKTDPEHGGDGPFVDAGIHLIDMVIHLFGAPLSVIAHGFQTTFPKSNDNATAILCYEKCSVVLNASQTTPAFGNHLLIYGTKGKIEALSTFGEKSVSRITLQISGTPESRDYPETNLYGAEVEAFANSIGAPAQECIGTTLEEALLGMRLLECINQSIVTGTSIAL